MEKKKNLMEVLTTFIENKLAPTLMKIFNRPTLNIIKNSMVNIMPFILFGSIMLLVSLLGTSNMGTEKPILEVLAPYSNQIGLMNSLTMGFMTLYFSVSIGINYAEEYHLDKTSCALLSLMSFILINIDGVADGSISIGSFGASALFPTMITSIIGLKIYKIFIKKQFVIKMPEGVPPAVGQAFSSIIPFAVVGITYWFIRTMLQFDIMNFLQTIMTPFFNGADNIVAFTLYSGLSKLLWAFGIHADSLFQGLLDPLKLGWISANGASVIAGEPITHIWVTAVERTCLWTGPVLGLLAVLMISKAKHLRAFSLTSLPAALFSIVEPVVFGLPLVMNPILLIPFVLSGIIGAIVTYGACLLHLVAIPFLELPWATPPFLIGFISSGDWKFIILALLNVAIGALIYYPFVKVFEKQEAKRITLEATAD